MHCNVDGCVYACHVADGHIEYRIIPLTNNKIQCNVDGCVYVFMFMVDILNIELDLKPVTSYNVM